jgi:lysophospholipase L1-like esterase
MIHLLYLLLSILLVSCTPVSSPVVLEISETQESEDTAVPQQTDLPVQTVRFLALGDSYTIGQGVSEDDRWPVQLGARLEEQGFEPQVTIIARTGWTTENLLFSLATDPPKGTYDFVSLLIGVNNQFRGGDPEEYRIRFRELLERAISFAGNQPQKVIVLSIPDWEVTPYAERMPPRSLEFDIDDFNAVNLQEAQTYGVRYVDITPISRQVTNDKELIAQDGLHPSGAMYALWVEELLSQVLEIIK